MLTWLGRAEEGVECLHLAMRLDPYSAPAWAHLMGRALMMSGHYAEAADAYLGNSFPRFGYHADAAGCFARLGLTEEAAAQAEEALRLKPDFTFSGYVSALPYGTEAQRERHRDILAAAPLPP